MLSIRSIALGLLTALLFGANVPAADPVPAPAPDRGTDWPQFQGPDRNGSSPERGLLRHWPEGGPAVVWRVPIKQGWGSPAVAGDDVIFGASETRSGQNEIITCLNAADGKERWKTVYETGHYYRRNIGWAPGGFRSTPAIGDKYVFTLGAIGHLSCLDRRTGAIVWSKVLWDEWVASGEKGYSFSPVLADGKLLLFMGDGCREMGKDGRDDPRSQQYVVFDALDPATGERLWRFQERHLKPNMEGEAQTPAVAEFGGKRCVLFSANRKLIALDIADGKPVWQFECVNKARATNIPTPLVLEKNIINIPDGEPTHSIEVDRARPETPAKFSWKAKFTIACAIHQFRRHGDYLYGFIGAIRGDDERHASESVLKLACVELATGKVVWSEDGFRNGVSITEADGLLFVRSYQTLRLVEATPAGYKLLGQVQTHDVFKATVNLTDIVMPVLSRGRLFVRTPNEMICYDVKAK